MIYLRPLNCKDIDRLFEIRSNPLNFNKKYTNFDTQIVTKNTTKEWFYNFINEIDAIRLGICLSTDQILIGCITLGKVNYNKSECELNIYIDIFYQNKGYGKKTLSLLFDYLKNILKINKIYLKVHKENKIAIHLYEKLGFVKIEEKNNFYYMKIILI